MALPAEDISQLVERKRGRTGRQGRRRASAEGAPRRLPRAARRAGLKQVRGRYKVYQAYDMLRD